MFATLELPIVHIQSTMVPFIFLTYRASPLHRRRRRRTPLYLTAPSVIPKFLGNHTSPDCQRCCILKPTWWRAHCWRRRGIVRLVGRAMVIDLRRTRLGGVQNAPICTNINPPQLVYGAADCSAAWSRLRGITPWGIRLPGFAFIEPPHCWRGRWLQRSVFATFCDQPPEGV